MLECSKICKDFTWADVPSDHSLLGAELNLKLKRIKQQRSSNKLDNSSCQIEDERSFEEVYVLIAKFSRKKEFTVFSETYLVLWLKRFVHWVFLAFSDKNSDWEKLLSWTYWVKYWRLEYFQIFPKKNCDWGKTAFLKL